MQGQAASGPEPPRNIDDGLDRAPRSESMRWLMLGAAIAIDLDFFENRGRRGFGGRFSFGGR